MDQPTSPAPAWLPLHPFERGSAPPGLAINATAIRRAQRLILRWELIGPLQALAIPPLGPAPQRRDELWTRTCLEAFLAQPGAEVYRELNLCPSGDWTLYRLAGYRQGLRPDGAIANLACQREEAPERLALAVELNLALLMGEEAALSPLNLGLTAVIADQTGATSYWALHHPSAQADFHHRGGFVLQLAAEGARPGAAPL